MKCHFFLLLLSTVAFAQQIEKVDFKSTHARLSLDTKTKTISGKVTYDFEVKSCTKIPVNNGNIVR